MSQEEQINLLQKQLDEARAKNTPQNKKKKKRKNNKKTGNK